MTPTFPGHAAQPASTGTRRAAGVQTDTVADERPAASWPAGRSGVPARAVVAHPPSRHWLQGLYNTTWRPLPSLLEPGTGAGFPARTIRPDRG
jgi:hypothetical protein